MTATHPPSLPLPHIHRTPRVTVAFVNNTSDRALATTEAQFLSLVRSSAGNVDLRIAFFTCPAIVRTVPPRTTEGKPYADVMSLFDSHVDALIVTGMEPSTDTLQDEPVWHPLSQLVDWVDRTGTPSMWSCLAAHAAVLRLDGIERAAHPRKVSDIMCCEAADDAHPLTSGLPRQWWTPHSRYFGLPEAALIAGGYRVLSRTVSAGVDIFVRQCRHPFVCLQGHPEYEPDSLLREYKRDLRRFYCGTRDEYPVAPASYFGPEEADVLEQNRQQALEDPERARAGGRIPYEIVAAVKSGTPRVQWQSPAVKIYMNWMALFGIGPEQADRCEAHPVKKSFALMSNADSETVA